ncbi:MAG: response regulator [Stigonema ocellatum SAG 48.90 = DSM 106950]|nr:response regulator [Stigonema ocellatum SAG 48.90 = DSM 106950]
MLIWGNLCLNQISAEVTCDQQVIGLTATEYNLLKLFLQNPNRIFSRRLILDRLWGVDDAPIEHAVTTHIKDLRKKLKAGGLTDDLLETVYGMGYRLKPAPTLAVTPHPAIVEEKNGEKTPCTQDLPAINRILEQFRDSFDQQVAVLEQAKTALLFGNLHQALQQAAKHEAHKLAGSMGSFGYPEGSRIARILEHLLIDDRTLTDDEIIQFSELVKALQQQLTLPTVTPTAQPVSLRQTHRVLVIDDDGILSEQLRAEADAWGMELTFVPDLTTARSRLALATPDAVLLDLNFPDTEENGLTLLRELTAKSPDLPIVVFTGRDSLADRLAVSRLGARQFLHKPATTEQIFQAIARVLLRPKISEAKVLIVDDDPITLARLAALLTPWGLEVTTLSEPQQFLMVLFSTIPDLLVVDIEMPTFTGLELCQVVRQDAQLGDLPILVVTAHTEAAALQEAFAAGADDFITKPVLGPELVTRVLSRIERTRSRLQHGKAREY